MRSFARILGAGAGLCLLYGVAAADTIKFAITLEPAQSGQPGKGMANLSLDTATKTMTGTIEYSGLSTPPQMAAFLSPPAKQNGNPGTLPIPLPANPKSPISIKMPMPDAAIAAIKGGEWICCSAPSRRPRSAARSSRRSSRARTTPPKGERGRPAPVAPRSRQIAGRR